MLLQQKSKQGNWCCDASSWAPTFCGGQTPHFPQYYTEQYSLDNNRCGWAKTTYTKKNSIFLSTLSLSTFFRAPRKTIFRDRWRLQHVYDVLCWLICLDYNSTNYVRAINQKESKTLLVNCKLIEMDRKWLWAKCIQQTYMSTYRYTDYGNSFLNVRGQYKSSEYNNKCFHVINSCFSYCNTGSFFLCV